jgi:hypothetical protein
MRLLVVSFSPPESSRASPSAITTQAQPPTPGFPWQPPSVYTIIFSPDDFGFISSKENSVCMKESIQEKGNVLKPSSFLKRCERRCFTKKGQLHGLLFVKKNLPILLIFIIFIA